MGDEKKAGSELTDLQKYIIEVDEFNEIVKKRIVDLQERVGYIRENPMESPIFDELRKEVEIRQARSELYEKRALEVKKIKDDINGKLSGVVCDEADIQNKLSEIEDGIGDKLIGTEFQKLAKRVETLEEKQKKRNAWFNKFDFDSFSKRLDSLERTPKYGVEDIFSAIVIFFLRIMPFASILLLLIGGVMMVENWGLFAPNGFNLTITIVFCVTFILGEVVLYIINRFKERTMYGDYEVCRHIKLGRLIIDTIFFLLLSIALICYEAGKPIFNGFIFEIAIFMILLGYAAYGITIRIALYKRTGIF